MIVCISRGLDEFTICLGLDNLKSFSKYFFVLLFVKYSGGVFLYTGCYKFA